MHGGEARHGIGLLNVSFGTFLVLKPAHEETGGFRRRKPSATLSGCASSVSRFPQRMDPTNVGQREVVLYFAEHCDDFGDPVEWYYRYKAIETFYEDMTSELALPSNQIKGLYDESDLDPELLRRIPDRPRMAPVDWSRDERHMY